MSLCAPYPFKQPPDPAAVAARVDEHRRGLHPSLGALAALEEMLARIDGERRIDLVARFAQIEARP